MELLLEQNFLEQYHFLMQAESDYEILCSPEFIFDKEKKYQINAYITIITKCDNIDNIDITDTWTIQSICINNKLIGYRTTKHCSDEHVLEIYDISCQIENSKFCIRCSNVTKINMKIIVDLTLAVK
jgi:hypothetical protein